MSAAKVTPIKAKLDVRLSPTVVVEQIEAARTLVFDAQAITAVTAAAVISDMTLDEYFTSRTLRHVSDMLGKVANLIEPDELVRVAADSEVSNGEA